MDLNMKLECMQFGFDKKILKEINDLKGASGNDETAEIEKLIQKLNSGSNAQMTTMTMKTKKTEKITMRKRMKSKKKKGKPQEDLVLVEKIKTLEKEREELQNETVPLKTYEKLLDDHQKQKNDSNKKIADLELKLQVLNEKMKKLQKDSGKGKDYEKMKKQNDELRRILKGKLTELDQKTELVENNQKLIEELEKTISELLDEKKKFLDDNQKQAEKIVRLEVENARLKDRLKEAEKKANNLPEKTGNPETDDLIDQLKKLQDEINQMRDENDNLKSDNLTSKNKIKNLDDEIEDLKRQLEKKDGEVILMKETITIREKEFIKLKQKLKKAEEDSGDVEEIQDKLNKVQKDLKKNKEEKEEVEENLEKLEKDLKKTKKEKNDIENEKNDLFEENEKLKKDLKNLKNEIQDLKDNEDQQNEIDKLKKDNKKLKDNLKEANEKVEELEDEIEKLKKKLNEEKDKNKNLEDEIEKLKKKLNEEKDKNKNLEDEIEELKKKLDEEKDKIKKMSDNDNSDQLNEELEKLKNENEDLKKENEDIKKENKDLKKENEDLKNENEDLKKENEDLKNENEDLKKENEELKKENEDLKNELDKLAEELKNKENEFTHIIETRVIKEKEILKMKKKNRPKNNNGDDEEVEEVMVETIQNLNAGGVDNDDDMEREKEGAMQVYDPNNPSIERIYELEEKIKTLKDEVVIETEKVIKLNKKKIIKEELDEKSLRRMRNQLKTRKDLLKNILEQEGKKDKFEEDLKVLQEIEEDEKDDEKQFKEKLPKEANELFEEYLDHQKKMNDILEKISPKNDSPSMNQIVKNLHNDFTNLDDFDEKENEGKRNEIEEDLKNAFKNKVPKEYKDSIDNLMKEYLPDKNLDEAEKDKKDLKKLLDDLENEILANREKKENGDEKNSEDPEEKVKNLEKIIRNLHKNYVPDSDFKEKADEGKWDEIEKDLENILENQVPKEFKDIVENLHKKDNPDSDFDEKVKNKKLGEIQKDIEDKLGNQVPKEFKEIVEKLHKQNVPDSDFDEKFKNEKYDEIKKDIEDNFGNSNNVDNQIPKELKDIIENLHKKDNPDSDFDEKFREGKFDEIKKDIEDKLGNQVPKEFKEIVENLHKKDNPDSDFDEKLNEGKFEEIKKDIEDKLGNQVPKEFKEIVESLHKKDNPDSDFDDKFKDKKYDEIKKDIEDKLGNNVPEELKEIIEKLHKENVPDSDFDNKFQNEKYDEIKKDIEEHFGNNVPEELKEIIEILHKENVPNSNFDEKFKNQNFSDIKKEIEENFGNQIPEELKEILEKLHKDNIPDSDFDKKLENKEYNDIKNDIQDIIGNLAPKEYKDMVEKIHKENIPDSKFDELDENKDTDKIQKDIEGLINDPSKKPEFKDIVKKLHKQNAPEDNFDELDELNEFNKMMEGIEDGYKKKADDDKKNLVNDINKKMAKVANDQSDNLEQMKNSPVQKFEEPKEEEDVDKAQELLNDYLDKMNDTNDEIKKNISNNPQTGSNLREKQKEAIEKHVDELLKTLAVGNDQKEQDFYEGERIKIDSETNMINGSVEILEECEKTNITIRRLFEKHESLSYKTMSEIFHAFNDVDSFMTNIGSTYTNDPEVIKIFKENISKSKPFEENLDICKRKAKFIDDKNGVFKPKVNNWLNETSEQIIACKKIENKLDEYLKNNEHSGIDVSGLDTSGIEKDFNDKLNNNNVRLRKIYNFVDQIIGEEVKDSQDLKILRNKLTKLEAKLKNRDKDICEKLMKQVLAQKSFSEDLVETQGIAEKKPIDVVQEIQINGDDPEAYLKAMDEFNKKMVDTNDEIQTALRNRDLNLEDEDEQEREIMAPLPPVDTGIDRVKRATRAKLDDDISKLRELIQPDEYDRIRAEIKEIDEMKIHPADQTIKYIEKMKETNEGTNLMMKDRVERTKIVEKEIDNPESIRRIMKKLERYLQDELETLQLSTEDKIDAEYQLEMEGSGSDMYEKAVLKMIDKMNNVNEMIQENLKKNKEQIENLKNNQKDPDSEQVNPDQAKKLFEKAKRLVQKQKDTMDVMRKDIVKEEFEIEFENPGVNDYIEGTNHCLDKLDENDDEIHERIKELLSEGGDGAKSQQDLKKLMEYLLEHREKSKQAVIEITGEDPKTSDSVRNISDTRNGLLIVDQIDENLYDIQRAFKKKTSEVKELQRDREEYLDELTKIHTKSVTTLENEIEIYKFLSRKEVNEKLLEETEIKRSHHELLASIYQKLDRTEAYHKKIDQQIKTNEDMEYEDISTIYHVFNQIYNFMGQITFHKIENNIFNESFTQKVNREKGIVECLEICKHFALFTKTKFETFKHYVKTWVTSMEKQIEKTVDIEEKIEIIQVSESLTYQMNKYNSFEKGETLEVKLRNNSARLQKIEAFIEKVELEGMGGGNKDSNINLSELYKKLNAFKKNYVEFMEDATDDELDSGRDYPEDINGVDPELIDNYLLDIVNDVSEILDENGDYVIERIDKVVQAKVRLENKVQTLEVVKDDLEAAVNRKTQEVARLLVKTALLMNRCQQTDDFIQTH